MNIFRSVLLNFIGSLLLAGPMSAQTTAAGGAADEYFRGYILKGEAERVEQAGDLQTALAKFRQAQEIFDSIAKNYPVWEVQMLTYRRQKLQDALTRVENKIAAPAAAPSPAPASAAPMPDPAQGFGIGSPAAQAGITPAAPQSPTGGLPSLSDFLSNYEQAYKRRFEQLDQQNKQYEADLMKWQKWYEWASGELKASKETTNALAQRGAQLEQAVAQMEREAAAGRANAGELKALRQHQAETAAQLLQAQQKVATMERTAKEAAQKLADASVALTKLQGERDMAVKERDEAVKKADTAGSERDKLAAESLGMKTELDKLKRTMGGSSNKEMLARNEQLRKDLDAARAQIATLKGDLTKKDAEITQLKGQLTSVQGELTTLRQQNAAYQTQVSELTLQLKDVQSKMDGKTPESPEMLAENQMLRGIILRQLRSQARQQEAKSNVIAELQKTENASKELLQHVEELKTARVTLTPDEEKLFTEPQLKEALSGSGFQATLMASSTEKSEGSKGASDTSSPAKAGAPGSASALMEKANQLLQDDKPVEAATAYEEVLRAEPKNTSALIGLGSAKMRAGKYADAEVALKKCLTSDPENETAHFTLGIIYFKQDRNKEAMTSFEKSIVKRQQNARAHHYLGIIATKMGLMDRAEREFKTALAIEPAYGDAHFNLAVLYVSWDPPKWDQARSHYSDALKKGVKPDANLEKILNGAAVSAR